MRTPKVDQSRSKQTKKWRTSVALLLEADLAQAYLRRTIAGSSGTGTKKPPYLRRTIAGSRFGTCTKKQPYLRRTIAGSYGTLVKPGVLPSHEETGVLCKRNSVALIKPFESFEFVVHYASLALCLVLLTMPRH